MSFPSWADDVRRHDRDRFTCAMFATEPARTHLLALYAFNLELSKAREVVSEPLLGRIRLQWWRDTLDAMEKDQTPDHQVAKAFQSAIEWAGLERAGIDELIDAREFDMLGDPPEDLAALLAYCKGTSSALSLMGLKILGVQDDAVEAAAKDVGLAWALSGLARAVPFHARQNRVYLPKNLLKKAGIAPEQIRKGEALNSVVKQVAEAAEESLERARKSLGKTDRKALPVLLPATLAEVYLRQLKKAGWNPFSSELMMVHNKGRLRLMINAWRRRF